MIVEAIPGEPFRYRCKSESQPGWRMVCLIDAECSCPDWTTRHKAYTQRTGQPYECKHQKAAWEQVKRDIRSRMRTEKKPYKFERTS